jgi:pimeloyl-ACP methyl ester carboxylesterase
MYIIVNGKKIEVKKQGRGEAILLVHGWGGTINSFQTVSNFLSENYQTITLSLPGFGNSDLPEKNWGIVEYTNCLLIILKKLKIKQVIFIGHSFGGSLGIYLASTHPEIISKLVLIAPSFKRTVTESKPSFLNQLFSKIPAGNLVRRIFYRVFYPSSDIWKYPKLETNFRKIITQDLTSNLKKIKTKTLIIWGEKDTETPVFQAYELNKNIMNSQLVIIPHATHGLPLKYPEVIAKDIKKFLEL